MVRIPEYWEDDEIWEEYFFLKSKEILPPPEFISDFKKMIDKARGNQEPPKFPVKFS